MYNNFYNEEKTFGEQIKNDLDAFQETQPQKINSLAKPIIALVALSIVGFIGYKLIKK
tara:strand:+ start:712 stop:885 length:174 start_codon:yes stop_codon:yes gene_type:complete